EGSIKRVVSLAPDEHGPIDEIFIELHHDYPDAHVFRTVIAVVGQAHPKLDSIRAILEEEYDLRAYATAADLLEDLHHRSSPNLVIGSHAELLGTLEPYQHALEAEVLVTDEAAVDDLGFRVNTLVRDFTTMDLIRSIDS